jgi:hypothetical protein
VPTLPHHPVIYEVNTIVWLSGLSRRAGRPVTLATVPDADWWEFHWLTLSNSEFGVRNAK